MRSARLVRRPSYASLGPPNTGDKLRSSNMLGFVCFIPLFGGVVPLSELAEPSAATPPPDGSLGTFELPRSAACGSLTELARHRPR